MRSTSISLFSLFAAAACTGGDAPPSAADYDAVASSLAAAHAPAHDGGDASALSDTLGIATGTMPLGLSLQGSGVISGTRLGISYSYQIACRDSSGNLLAACGPLTDWASASATWSGALSLPGLSVSIGRTAQWEISTILSGVATVSGSGSFQFDGTLTASGETHAWHLALTSDDDNLRVTESPRLIVGGTIHDVVDATRMATGNDGAVDAELHIDAELTFHADGTADLVLDGDQHYVIGTDGVAHRQ
jgi:hypothetical protein